MRTKDNRTRQYIVRGEEIKVEDLKAGEAYAIRTNAADKDNGKKYIWGLCILGDDDERKLKDCIICCCLGQHNVWRRHPLNIKKGNISFFPLTEVENMAIIYYHISIAQGVTMADMKTDIKEITNLFAQQKEKYNHLLSEYDEISHEVIYLREKLCERSLWYRFLSLFKH